MDETSSGPRWSRLTAGGLVLGPALAALSVTVGLTFGPQPTSMRTSFDLMAEHGSAMLAQDLFEAFGFAIVLACFASAARESRSRGGVFGIVGAVLAVLGIVGFAVSNAAGLSVVALAQLPNRDAAYTMARTITTSGPLATLNEVGFALEVAGQLGILLVLTGLWRAYIATIWPAVIAVVGIAVNAVVGTLAATLIADVLLLVVGAWIAVKLLRGPRTDSGAVRESMLPGRAA